MLALALLGGCSGFSSEEKPLPDSTFADMLTELHLLKARTSIEEPAATDLRDSLFAAHDVDRSTFYATLDYYSRRPKAFASLYGSIVDSLRSLRSPQRNRPPSQEQVQDSVYRERRRTGDSP